MYQGIFIRYKRTIPLIFYRNSLICICCICYFQVQVRRPGAGAMREGPRGQTDHPNCQRLQGMSSLYKFFFLGGGAGVDSASN